MITFIFNGTIAYITILVSYEKPAIIKKLKGKALIFEPPQFQGLMEHVHTL